MTCLEQQLQAFRVSSEGSRCQQRAAQRQPPLCLNTSVGGLTAVALV
jgi:hypothetical protein